MQRLEDTAELEAEDVVALRREVARVDEANIRRLREGAGAVACELVRRRLARRARGRAVIVALELTVLEVRAEVVLITAEDRRVDSSRGRDPAFIVERAVDRVTCEEAGIQP